MAETDDDFHASLSRRLAVAVVVTIVRLYRVTLGPLMGGHCRFQPTCSQYMIDTVTKYGVIRGIWRGIRRITRCHPWGGMGDDPA